MGVHSPYCAIISSTPCCLTVELEVPQSGHELGSNPDPNSPATSLSLEFVLALAPERSMSGSHVGSNRGATIFRMGRFRLRQPQMRLSKQLAIRERSSAWRRYRPALPSPAFPTPAVLTTPLAAVPRSRFAAVKKGLDDTESWLQRERLPRPDPTTPPFSKPDRTPRSALKPDLPVQTSQPEPPQWIISQ